MSLKDHGSLENIFSLLLFGKLSETCVMQHSKDLLPWYVRKMILWIFVTDLTFLFEGNSNWTLMDRYPFNHDSCIAMPWKKCHGKITQGFKVAWLWKEYLMSPVRKTSGSAKFELLLVITDAHSTMISLPREPIQPLLLSASAELSEFFIPHITQVLISAFRSSQESSFFIFAFLNIN